MKTLKINVHGVLVPVETVRRLALARAEVFERMTLASAKAESRRMLRLAIQLPRSESGSGL